MGFYRTVKRMLPARLKRPLRELADEYSLRTQPKLSYDATGLLSASSIDLPAIMHNADIVEGYSVDSANIAAVYPSGEIFGGVNPGDRRAIYHLVAHLRPRRVLEIGTHVGASTIFIAAALRRFGGADAHLTTADIIDVNAVGAPWSALGLAKSPAGFMNELGLASMTSFVNEPALDLLHGPASYDFVFLDGDHSPRSVYREIAAALKVLAPRGVVLLHDFYPRRMPLTPDGDVIHGPAKAAERIGSETDEIAFLPLGNLPWETKAGGNATSLALVAGCG